METRRLIVKPPFDVEQILRKRPFRTIRTGMDSSYHPPHPWERQGEWIYFSQADFLRQYYVSGHKINDPMYYKDKTKIVERRLADGSTVTVPYIQHMIRVAIPYQEMIATKHLTALTGNNIAFSTPGDSTKEDETLFNSFMNGWKEKDMETAWYQSAKSALITGDAAFCGWLSGGKFGWRVFSYLDGDTLWPHYDNHGRMDAFGRSYTLMDAKGALCTYLDVWDDTYVHHYAQTAEDGQDVQQVAGFGGWVYNGSDRHGFESLPIAYMRIDLPPWVQVQPSIDQIELAFSRLAENNKAYALRILFTKGADLAMESTIDGTPYQINTEETDADARFLEPANMSGSFKTEIDALEEAIYRGSFTVKTPDVRGSDLSGLAVELLFTDSNQKAHCDAQDFKPFVGDMVSVFKAGWAVEDGTPAMRGARILSEILPFMPKSETEEVSNIAQLVNSGSLSRQSASENATTLGYGKTAEWHRILSEERETLVGIEPLQKDNNDGNNLKVDQNVQ